ncbi:phage portal protein [Kitasatospora purpeofusca]|uniref:phage portal protein n=1 Tax=Kitasatospora purpeofusca TaxID=67352 RepID=UPI0036F167A0
MTLEGDSLAPALGDKKKNDLKQVLKASLNRFNDDFVRFSYIESYLNGDQEPPYIPKGASREYKAILDQSCMNFLPLIVDAVAQQLYVEGYRKPDSPDDDKCWEYWRRNSLDAWQHSAHRDALSYGVSYITVLPGDKAPVIKPVSPLSMAALYNDPIHDEWPEWAMQHSIDYTAGKKRSRIKLLDNENVYTYVGDYIHTFTNLDSFDLKGIEKHGLGVCPVVRMRNRLTTSPNVPVRGEVEPLIVTQDRINSYTLSESMIVHFASWKQKWIAGIELPDDYTDPDTGITVSAAPDAAVNRLWSTEDPTTKFGEFSESDVTKVLAATEATVKKMSSVSQVPPVYLLGDIVNLSAEALAASEAGLQRKVQEKRTIFGEAWAQTMRLAAVADDGKGELDDLFDNRIVWRDTEARSLASTVDALGKLTQMLQVPPEALWERVPGVTSSDVAAWKELAKEADSLGNMLGMLQDQAAAGQAAVPAQKGEDNAKPGTNVPGKSSTAKVGYGTPSDRKDYHR